MAVTIQVIPLADGRDISFQSVVLTHVECQNGQIAKHRNPSSDEYTLRCSCGLEVVLFGNGGAVEYIKRVAIGAESTPLEAGSYSCNRGAITISITA